MTTFASKSSDVALNCKQNLSAGKYTWVIAVGSNSRFSSLSHVLKLLAKNSCEKHINSPYIFIPAPSIFSCCCRTSVEIVSSVRHHLLLAFDTRLSFAT